MPHALIQLRKTKLRAVFYFNIINEDTLGFSTYILFSALGMGSMLSHLKLSHYMSTQQ